MSQNTNEELFDAQEQEPIPDDSTNSTQEPQSTEKMEVHHHAHHDHGKKNWKSYFWEFLMLFLAVFCGFLAEYQLEHVIEKDREKQYVKGLIQNLQADTANINRTLLSNQRKQAAWDSLLTLAGENLATSSNTSRFYSYFLQGTFIPTFRPTNATIVQLKNSGNLRLISKKEVVDSILRYDMNTERIVAHTEALSIRNDEVWNSVYSIMYTWLFYDSSFADYGKRILKNQPPLIAANSQDLQVFYGNLTRCLLTLQTNRALLQQHKSKADTLMYFLRDKYGIAEN